MIEVIEKIDLVEENENGIINLIIIYNTQIDNLIETQIRLKDKVEFNLDMIKTSEFIQKYCITEKMHVTILSHLKYEPTELIKELARRIAEWSDYHNVNFVWNVKKS
ncbi:MAG: hypothetical protein ACK5JH_10635 [Anaerocolumna sp.]